MRKEQELTLKQSLRTSSWTVVSLFALQNWSSEPSRVPLQYKPCHNFAPSHKRGNSQKREDPHCCYSGEICSCLPRNGVTFSVCCFLRISPKLADLHHHVSKADNCVWWFSFPHSPQGTAAALTAPTCVSVPSKPSLVALDQPACLWVHTGDHSLLFSLSGYNEYDQYTYFSPCLVANASQQHWFNTILHILGTQLGLFLLLYSHCWARVQIGSQSAQKGEVLDTGFLPLGVSKRDLTGWIQKK